MDPVFKSSRCDLHQHRGGSCGTATSFTRATIDLAIRDLLSLTVSWRQASHLLRFAPLQGMGAFQPRTGAQGLEITTRKAARGTRAHFVACESFLVALVSTHRRFTCQFWHLLVPEYFPSAPISGVVIDASSMWAWWMKPKRRRGSQVRFLPLLDVRGAWHVP